MQRATVRIELDDRAYELALQPARPGVVPLHPAARAVLEHAQPAVGRRAARIVRCTVPEARALLDHFDSLCDRLTALDHADATVCAGARDAVRRALVAASA